jgi:Family of unknown function (DUF5829)
MSDEDICPHLDHVFLTVDLGAIKEMVGTEFLTSERFGRFRIKNATSTLIGPYRTANVAGRNTFIEFFPEDAPPFAGVRVGMVLSFDKVGQSPRAHERLTKLGVPVQHELVRRSIDGHDEPQPWYHLLRPDFGADSPFTLFLSEITPEYFDRLGARRSPDGRQSREAYLAAAMKAPQLSAHCFDDLRHVVLRLRPARAEQLRKVLAALGYRSLPDNPLRLEGPGASIELVADDHAPEGLLELGLSLTRPHIDPPRVYQFGSGSQLSLSPNGEANAVWRFAGPTLQQVGELHA